MARKTPRNCLVGTIFALGLVAGCGPGPTNILPAPPTHSTTTTTPSAAPPTSATSPKPTESVTPQVSTPTPPPPSPIAQLLAHPPAMPPTPARTCPTLPKAPTNVAVQGKAVIVMVRDYLSLAPIADVRVNIFHGDICHRNTGCKPSHPHPEEQLKMTGKTDAQGRIVFDVPDLDYSVVIPEDPVPGHLPFSTIYNMSQQKCHELSSERRSANQRAILFDGYMVPETMLRIRSNEHALASTLQLEELVTWLRAHQDATVTVRGGGDAWEVGFGYGNQFKRLVLVNGFDGAATILTRWN